MSVRAAPTDTERAYAAILKRNPDDFDALHRLGFIRYQKGRHAEALKLIGKALEKRPQAADALSHYGMVLRKMGRLENALTYYEKSLSIKADYPDALNNRGNVLVDLGRHEEALASFDKALSVRPLYPEALYNRGSALMKLERPDEALVSYDRALELKPFYPSALNNRGSALQHLKRYEEALSSYDRALAIDPEFSDALNNRLTVLHHLKRYEEVLAASDKLLAAAPLEAHRSRASAFLELKRFEEALEVTKDILRLEPQSLVALNMRGAALLELRNYEEALATFERALKLDANRVEALNNRANTLQEMGRFEEALLTFDSALEIEPENPNVLFNRGNTLAELERFDEARAFYERALRTKPDYSDALLALGMLHLRLGRFEAGWKGYEHRWQPSDPNRPAQHIPEWKSEPLHQKSILVYAEQGLGDCIQFVRFLDLMAPLAKNVTFLAPKPLLRLFNAFNDRVRITGELRPGESFDFQCALMSLPNRLGTDISAVSRSVPYLTAETTLCSQWGKLGSSAGFKIGICWQGNSKAKADKGRSVPLEKLFPISSLEGVRLISLQKLHGLEQLDRLPHGMRVETLGDGFDSGSDAFVDTAAVMEQLDLIITTDTAIAHLAGALGRPTWVALQYFPEWRWLLNRDDSPWYPTMKLFRQPDRGNWDAVFAQMATKVQKVMQLRASKLLEG